MQQSPIREKRIKGQGHKAEGAKGKFQEQRTEKAKAQAIEPMNKKQAEYLAVLEDPKCSIIVATGYAGTSKTYIPTRWSCNRFLSDRLHKFVLSRPAISNSKSLGFFTGDHIEKMSIWLGPVLSTVKEALGADRTEVAIKREDITFIPLEVIKGSSLGSTDPNRPVVFLVDEAEDLSRDEVIKICTRIGKNCKLILAGDILQSELKDASGLKWLIEFKKKHNISEISHIDFNEVNDIVRSDIVKKFITCLQREERDEKNKAKAKTQGQK